MISTGSLQGLKWKIWRQDRTCFLNGQSAYPLLLKRSSLYDNLVYPLVEGSVSSNNGGKQYLYRKHHEK